MRRRHMHLASNCSYFRERKRETSNKICVRLIFFRIIHSFQRIPMQTSNYQHPSPLLLPHSNTFLLLCHIKLNRERRRQKNVLFSKSSSVNNFKAPYMNIFVTSSYSHFIHHRVVTYSQQQHHQLSIYSERAKDKCTLSTKIKDFLSLFGLGEKSYIRSATLNLKRIFFVWASTEINMN